MQIVNFILYFIRITLSLDIVLERGASSHLEICICLFTGTLFIPGRRYYEWEASCAVTASQGEQPYGTASVTAQRGGHPGTWGSQLQSGAGL